MAIYVPSGGKTWPYHVWCIFNPPPSLFTWGTIAQGLILGLSELKVLCLYRNLVCTVCTVGKKDIEPPTRGAMSCPWCRCSSGENTACIYLIWYTQTIEYSIVKTTIHHHQNSYKKGWIIFSWFKIAPLNNFVQSHQWETLVVHSIELVMLFLISTDLWTCT